MPAGRDQIKPMQRLVRLMAVLEQAGSAGVDRDRLLDVADYGDRDPGSQLAKDLQHLRRQGWQIDNLAGVGELARYRMVPGDNRLRLTLTPDQLAALQRAVILADRADLARSLGVRESGLPAGIGTQVVPRGVDGRLTLALQAVRLAARIRFTYKGTRRAVDPATVRLPDYHWYLSGTEVGSAVVKHFVVGRMSGPELDRPGTARPVSEVERIPRHPLLWTVDDPVRVVLRTPADYVPDVERWLLRPDAARAGEGWVEMAYTVTNRAAFRARLHVLGTRVDVQGPEGFRAEMLDELRTLAGR